MPCAIPTSRNNAARSGGTDVAAVCGAAGLGAICAPVGAIAISAIAAAVNTVRMDVLPCACSPAWVRHWWLKLDRTTNHSPATTDAVEMGATEYQATA